MIPSYAVWAASPSPLSYRYRVSEYPKSMESLPASSRKSAITSLRRCCQRRISSICSVWKMNASPSSPARRPSSSVSSAFVSASSSAPSSRPTRGAHEAGLPLQPGLAQIERERGRNLLHVVDGRNVTDLPRRAAVGERGVERDRRVPQLLAELEQLGGQREPLRQRVRRGDRHAAQHQHPGEGPRISDASSRRERAVAERETAVAVVGPDQLGRQRREELGPLGGVARRLGADRVLERVDELPVGSTDPGEEPAVDGQHRRGLAARVLESLRRVESAQERASAPRPSRRQLGSPEREQEVAFLRCGDPTAGTAAPGPPRPGPGGRRSPRLRRPADRAPRARRPARSAQPCPSRRRRSGTRAPTGARVGRRRRAVRSRRQPRRAVAFAGSR